MRPIGSGDDAYPPRLRDVGNPPDPLWIDGDPAVLRSRAVSVVGTRRMTPYGARVAHEVASAFAAAGIIVVSGLAQGIDSAAHAGALDARGRTIAVLGAGLVAYLHDARGRRRRLAQTIRGQGALVSEFPPHAPPRPWTFAQRDTTIAALGEATIVIEAPEGSGALITAAEARRIGRPVFAIPGPLGARTSVGTNELIASGQAQAVTGVAMLLESFGVAAAAPASPEASDRILEALAIAPTDPDALARRLGVSHSELAVAVARLVVAGKIATSADGRLERR